MAAAPNSVTRSALERQLLFARRNYRMVSLHDLARSLNAPATDACLAVTFDDGYDSFLTHAYPVLRALDVPATLFVVTGLVGGPSRWNEELGYPVAPLLDWRDIERLDRTLIDVGSHGATHRTFGILSAAEIEREIVSSRLTLESHVGGPVSLFCFPYGSRRDLHPGATRLLAANGFEAACSSKWGRFNEESDRFALKRIAIWSHDTESDFRRKLDGSFDWLEIKEAVGFRLRRHRRVP